MINRIINNDLRKENSGLLSQIKALESDTKMHVTEIAELREVSSRNGSRSMSMLIAMSLVYEDP